MKLKFLYKIVVVFVLAITVVSCSNKEEIPADVEINDFVWKGMNAYYLWQSEKPDLADTRFFYARTIEQLFRWFFLRLMNCFRTYYINLVL